MEGRVRKLREAEGRPVYGVRTRLECGCGMIFYAVLTVGVNRPVAWCPRCRSRSVLQIEWRIDGPLAEGAVVRWRLR